MINVFYSGNDKVFDMMIISLVSMAKKCSEPINAYILTMDLTDENPKYKPIGQAQADYLQGIIREYNPNNKITIIDTKQVYKENMQNTVNNPDRFTPYALLRVLADKLDLPDKMIYLDVDTVINNDIAELYNQDIEDYEMGVVRDVFIFGLRLHKTYFNSGMLLMNLKKIKETGMLERTRELIKTKRMSFLDQDALNFAITKKKMLDRRFNSIHVKNKRYDLTVVHHMCDCRAWLVFRYKSKDFEKVKKYMPYYKPLIVECEKLIQGAKNL